MKLLIDSHVLIWLLYEPERFSVFGRETLEAAEVVYVSIVSLWELTLKFTKHKLAYPPDELAAGVIALQLTELSIRTEHLQRLPLIKLSQADPFDALLIAQNEAEGCTLMTADSLLLQSPYRVIKV